MRKEAKNSLLLFYQKEVVPSLMKEWKLSNKLAVPRIKKVVVNIGMSDRQNRDKAVENVKIQLAVITGQRPLLTRAKRSIAEFAIRQGDPVGLKVTLRGKRMYQFLQKFIQIVLPRVKDFQGLKRRSFDAKGSYTLGLTEQTIFPEIDYDKIDKVRGFEITVVTGAKNSQQTERLLELMGFPFEKKE